MTVEQFALAFPEKGPRLGWLLGAGASAAAGIPTGFDMIVDFKTRLFCAQTKLPRREIDPGDPVWLERITAYFDGAHGMPPAGHPDEYAAAFEAVFPDPADRRTYIEDAVRRGTPSFGHRVFAGLITSRQVPCVFTTNFDPLVEQASVVADDLLPAAERVHLTVAAIDSAERAERCLRESAWPMLAKLHGDYKEDRLKNTGAELVAQDERLRGVLVRCCARFGLAITGYSGRDTSVMSALLDAAAPGSFPVGLYWFFRPGDQLLPAATELLERAAEASVAVYTIEVENFDELNGELDRQAALPDVLAEHIRGHRPAAAVHRVVLPTAEADNFPVLRCSALPLLSVPGTARRLALSRPATTPQLRDLLKEGNARGVIAGLGREASAFGFDERLLSALVSLGPRADGEIALDPAADSWALGLLYDALTRALARGRPLRPRLRRAGHTLVVVWPNPDRDDDAARRDRAQLERLARAYPDPLTGAVPGFGFPFAEAIRVRLEWHLDRWWCVFDPFTWVERPRLEPADPDGTDSPDSAARRRSGDATGDWRRERWATRRNREWAEIVDAWAHLLSPQGETTVRAIGVRDAPGIDAEFVVSDRTAWSRPTASHAWPGAAP